MTSPVVPLELPRGSSHSDGMALSFPRLKPAPGVIDLDEVLALLLGQFSRSGSDAGLDPQWNELVPLIYFPPFLFLVYRYTTPDSD